MCLFPDGVFGANQKSRVAAISLHLVSIVVVVYWSLVFALSGDGCGRMVETRGEEDGVMVCSLVAS